jgi:hypothetical protein
LMFMIQKNIVSASVMCVGMSPRTLLVRMHVFMFKPMDV